MHWECLLYQNDMKAKAEGLLDPERLQQFAVEADFDKALKNGGGKIPSICSVESSKSKLKKKNKDDNEKKRGRDERGNKSSKKKKS